MIDIKLNPVSKEEFIILIKSIGFVLIENALGNNYYYKDFHITVYRNDYSFRDLDGLWHQHNTYDELEMINFNFKKELRSIKLEKILK